MQNIKQIRNDVAKKMKNNNMNRNISKMNNEYVWFERIGSMENDIPLLQT